MDIKEKEVASSKNASADEKKLNELLLKVTRTANDKSNRQSIYKDVEHLKDFDGGKKWRNKMRKKLLQTIMPAFIVAMNSKDVNAKEIQKNAFAAFKTFYSESYTLNDFSLNSVLADNAAQHNKDYVVNFFEIVKIYLTKNK